MPSVEYSAADRCQLLRIARISMTRGVQTGRSLVVDTTEVPAKLAELRASFVTLRLDGELRGCTGSLEAVQPLATDVAETACQTALADHRFCPVRAGEVDDIEIEISVLSPLKRIAFRDEEDLLTRLEPGVDGVLLEAGPLHATFLPKVWEQFPTPRQFLIELKRKAGLPDDYRAPGMVLYRYHTESFGDTAI